MNRLLLFSIALVLFIFYGGENVPKIMKDNKEILLGIVGGLVLCSFLGMKFEGFGTRSVGPSGTEWEVVPLLPLRRMGTAPPPPGSARAGVSLGQQYFNIIVEKWKGPPAYPPNFGLEDHETYRIWANLTPQARNVYALSGRPNNPLITPPAWKWAREGGEGVADFGGVNSAFFAFFPESRFDSFLTVGNMNGATNDEDAGILAVSPGFPFNWGEEVRIESRTGGAVFKMDPVSAPGGAALLAQFTLPVSQSQRTFAGYLQGKATEGDDWNGYFTLTLPPLAPDQNNAFLEDPPERMTKEICISREGMGWCQSLGRCLRVGSTVECPPPVQQGLPAECLVECEDSPESGPTEECRTCMTDYMGPFAELALPPPTPTPSPPNTTKEICDRNPATTWCETNQTKCTLISSNVFCPSAAGMDAAGQAREARDAYCSENSDLCGCIDPAASNYDQNASVDDGSCVDETGNPFGYDTPERQARVRAAAPSAADCKGEWSAWGDCSKPCGKGTQSRSYSVFRSAAGGGAACDVADGTQDYQDCNTEACPSPDQEEGATSSATARRESPPPPPPRPPAPPGTQWRDIPSSVAGSTFYPTDSEAGTDNCRPHSEGNLCAYLNSQMNDPELDWARFDGSWWLVSGIGEDECYYSVEDVNEEGRPGGDGVINPICNDDLPPASHSRTVACGEGLFRPKPYCPKPGTQH